MFANYGHVNSLAPLWHRGKLWLVAGGASSALLGGFLALIDPDKGLSIAPEGGTAALPLHDAGPGRAGGLLSRADDRFGGGLSA